MELVFSEGGGEADIPATTIGSVPPDVQTLLWGDRDALLQQLLDLQTGDEGEATALLDQICLIDAQREYYTKYVDAGGIAIIGDRHVSDKFFFAAQEIVLTMTSKRPELRGLLSPAQDFRLVLNAWHSDGIPEMWPDKTKNEWPGIGWCFPEYCAAQVSIYYTAAQEERLGGLNTIIHEFAHAMHHVIREFDPTFQSRLETAYAIASEIEWYDEGDYAMTNVSEYWAEGVAYWFDEAARPEKALYHDRFLEADPHLYALLDEWLPLVYLRKLDRKWASQ